MGELDEEDGDKSDSSEPDQSVSGAAQQSDLETECYGTVKRPLFL